MPVLQTLILTAILPESKALSQGLHLTKVTAPVPFWQSEAEGLALAQVGVKASRLATCAHLPQLASFRAILLAGLAGALSPTLRVGDVVIDGQCTLPPHPARNGRIHMAPQIVSTAAAKQRLFSKTSCIAVDMESEIVRQFAHTRGVPFLHVRAISDAAGDALDPALLRLVDDDGRPRIGRSLGLICRRPGMLPAMLRVQKATTLALANLSKTVNEIVASGWPPVRE
ncbi:MAG: phosphorylase family protein [Phycisphaerae bacterium]